MKIIQVCKVCHFINAAKVMPKLNQFMEQSFCITELQFKKNSSVLRQTNTHCLAFSLYQLKRKIRAVFIFNKKFIFSAYNIALVVVESREKYVLEM